MSPINQVTENHLKQKGCDLKLPVFDHSDMARLEPSSKEAMLRPSDIRFGYSQSANYFLSINLIHHQHIIYQLLLHLRVTINWLLFLTSFEAQTQSDPPVSVSLRRNGSWKETQGRIFG